MAAGQVEKDLLIKAKTIYLGDGQVLHDGQILVRRGKIFSVGALADVAGDYEVLETPVVTPGFIDTHSHLCMPTNHDSTRDQPSVPGKRALDLWNPDCESVLDALAAGVTTVVYRPGSASVIGGASVAIKLKGSPGNMSILREPADIKMALGIGDDQRETSTADGFLKIARHWFDDAIAYRSKVDEARNCPSARNTCVPPPRDLNLEILAKVLDRKLPIHVHNSGTFPAEEAAAVMQLAREYNLKVTIAHAARADVLLGRFPPSPDLTLNVGPSVMLMSPYGSRHPLNTAALMAKNGYRVTLQSDGDLGVHEQYLRRMASSLVRYGLSKASALRSITADAAAAMELGDRVGSITPGLDADLVFFNGEPLEFSSSVTRVLVDGKTEFSRSMPEMTAYPSILADPLPFSKAFQFPRDFAIVSAQIVTMAGPLLTDATLIVRDGKISAIGKQLQIPRGLRTFSLPGKYIMPGLIELGFSGAQLLKPEPPARSQLTRTPSTKFDPHSMSLSDSLTVGITTTFLHPSLQTYPSPILAGRGLIIKTFDPLQQKHGVEPGPAMITLGHSASEIGTLHSSEMSVAATLRQELVEAMEAMNLRIDLRSPRQEQLVDLVEPALTGAKPIVVNCESPADIFTAIRVSDEFGIKIVVKASRISNSLIEQLAKRDIALILDKYSGAYEVTNLSKIEESGVVLGFRYYEADGIVRSRLTIPYQGSPLAMAGVSVSEGYSEDAALRSMTTDPAKILGISDRVGSIEKGKDADFLILSGPPLATATIPQMVVVGGRVAARNETSDFADVSSQSVTQ